MNDIEYFEKKVQSDYKFDKENHVHSNKGKPLIGTSSVMSVLSKPLTWWASGLAVEKFGWINGKKRVNGKYITIDNKTRINAILPHLEAIKKETPEQFLARCDEAYKAHSVKLDTSSTDGTDLHADLETYVREHMTNFVGTSEEEVLSKLNPKVRKFAEWTALNVKRFIWSEVHCFDLDLWVGGISDLGVELKDGKTGIIDFKSSKEAYESQFIQCAGYDLQLSKNGGYTNNGMKLFDLEKPLEFYAIIPFGGLGEKDVDNIIEFRYNVDELKEIFKSTLQLYKYLNK